MSSLEGNYQEKVSEVTEFIEQEYKNPFGIHVNKEKLGVVVDDDIVVLE